MELIAKIIGGILLGYSNYYIISDLLKEETKKLTYQKVLLLVIYSLCIIINYYLIDNALQYIHMAFQLH